MTATVTKMHLKKQEPELYTEEIKKCSKQNIFVGTSLLIWKKENNEIAHLKMYLQIFKTVLKRHAPMKKHYIQANHGPLMSKTLRKNYILRNKT